MGLKNIVIEPKLLLWVPAITEKKRLSTTVMICWLFNMGTLGEGDGQHYKLSAVGGLTSI